jgi:predicted ATPase/DNA-binding CsgD family transcriptional regulator
MNIKAAVTQSTGEHRAETMAEPLKRRELEILARLAQNQTNQEIAEALSLALSSVKWYTRQIYAKLGVNNRRQAVTRATALGLAGLGKSAAPVHNLPAQLSTFVGREAELARLQRLLLDRTSRLLTLLGPGGCGKSRLALQLATATTGHYPDGVWWVELAPLTDPLLVPQAIALALNVPEQPRRSATELLVEHIRSKTLLLVLDNCEHLAEACASLTTTLLRACTQLQLLATSREALRIEGEVDYSVPPLSLPDMPNEKVLAPAGEDLERISHSEALRLFLDRARAVRPDIELTAQTAPALVQICRRLEGLPLAIELAAARVKMLQVEEIAARLEFSLRLLRRGRRSAPERHQSLTAALDWSYDLLSAAERALLRRLSVFAGGFTLESAQAVCSGEALERDEVFDVLSLLVDKSLVVVEVERQPSRYRLLEPIREYGRNRLQEAAEMKAIARQHAAYFADLAERANPEMLGAQQALWIARLALERDNLRAAVQRAVAQGDVSQGVRFAAALAWFWYFAGSLNEGRRSVAGILDLAGAAGQNVARAKALQVAARLAYFASDYEAMRAPIEESTMLLRKLGDRHELAHSLIFLGRTRIFQGDAIGARTALEEAASIFRAAADRPNLVVAITALTTALMSLADYGAARSSAEELRSISVASGDRISHQQALNDLGDIARCEANYEEAEKHYQECLTLLRELGIQNPTAAVLHNLGRAVLVLGNLERAKALFTESLALHQAHGDQPGVLEVLAGFAALIGAQGQLQLAAALEGAVAAQRDALGVPIWPAERIEHERSLERLRITFDDAALAAAMAEGRHLSLAQATTLALDAAADLS